MMDNIVSYINGNYKVILDLNDGTMIRCTMDNELKPEFPDSMDIKITNSCSIGCPWCHEQSVRNGEHGDILSPSFIDKLHPYTSLAIGGGNILEHPDLLAFLEKCKALKLIPSVTVNQIHFMENQQFIKKLIDDKLIYGLGVSLTKADTEFINTIKQYPNAVVHTIAGITTEENYKLLANHGLKILILGYKTFGRGVRVLNNFAAAMVVNYQKEKLSELLPQMIKDKWYKNISFDNLALKQLDVKSLISDALWKTFYMGEEGTTTMYVDMVKREFATNSTSAIRYPLLDNIEDMLDTIHHERGKRID